MIDGITVLSKAVMAVDTGLTCWGWSIVAFGGSLLGIIAIIVIIIMCCEKDHSFGFWVMSIALLFVCIIMWHQKSVTEEVYEYKALIEETTSFTKFSEDYILLDKDGDIWCFRERTSTERFD